MDKAVDELPDVENHFELDDNSFDMDDEEFDLADENLDGIK